MFDDRGVMELHFGRNYKFLKFFLKKKIKNILEIGLSANPNLNSKLKEKIILTNKFSLVIFSFFIFYVIFYFALKMYFALSFSLFSALGIIVGFYFMSIGHRTLCRVNVILMSCVAIFGTDLASFHSVQVEFYYLPAVLLAFMLFESAEMKTILFSSMLPIVFWFLPKLTVLNFNVYFPIQGVFLNYFSVINILGAYLITIYFAILFMRSSDRLERNLVVANKFSALGEMAAGIAHEVNNPLAIISLKISHLKRMALKNEYDVNKNLESLEKIEMTVDRIAKIINGLKNFSRTSDSDEFTNNNLSAILTDSIDLCREKFKIKNIKVRCRSDVDVIVRCRPVQLSQVILNLMNNSIDAIGGLEDPWVEIHVFLKNKNIVCISVTDSGLGISSEIQEKMMQPFFTTKDVGSGTGLGLSISMGLVESHGGKLRYEATSVNTRFEIELPFVSIVV